MREWLASPSGEIGTKQAGTQRAFLDLLVENLRTRAQGIGLKFSLERDGPRFILSAREEPNNSERLVSLLQSHIGLAGFRPLIRLPSRISPETLPWEELLPARPFTFTLYAKRFANQEARARALAWKKALLEVLNREARARLSRWDNHPPERLAWLLEGRKDETWLLLNKVPAPGGLPVGSGGRVLVLFSGGPDSILAAYLLARRGQKIELVFFDDEEPGRKELVLEAARALAFFQPQLSLRLWHLNYKPFLEGLSGLVPERERCFFCKALMFSLAETLMPEKDAALASGEILGEQASQTLPALLFTGAGRTVLRPVVAFNKEEVFQVLEEAGLSQVARLPLPSCPWAPKRPHTKPTKSPFTIRKILPKLGQSPRFKGIEVKWSA